MDVLPRPQRHGNIQAEALPEYNNGGAVTALSEHGGTKLPLDVLDSKNLQYDLTRISKAQLEREELYHKFMDAIQEVQQKCSLRNLLPEKKLSALIATLEKEDSQLNEVLALSQLDPTALSIVTGKLEAHNDLLHTFEAKLQEFGVPKDSLGFISLENNVKGQRLGSGQAGVVSSPT